MSPLKVTITTNTGVEDVWTDVDSIEATTEIATEIDLVIGGDLHGYANGTWRKAVIEAVQ